MAGVMDVLKVDVMDGVKIGSTVAVGPLFCYRRTAPAPQGQSLPASLRGGKLRAPTATTDDELSGGPGSFR